MRAPKRLSKSCLSQGLGARVLRVHATKPVSEHKKTGIPFSGDARQYSSQLEMVVYCAA
jgi:hypothetical protein